MHRDNGPARGGQNRKKRPLFTPGISNKFIDGENSVGTEQLTSLQNLYETHPTVMAAASLLEAQILKSGLTLQRGGQPIECSPEFQDHLDSHWTGFTQKLVRHFQIAGFAVVTYEQPPAECATSRFQRVQRRGSAAEARRMAEALFAPPKVPYVAPFRSYRLSWAMGGRMRYVREYRVYPIDHTGGFEPDDDAVLHIYQDPDDFGNVNSPMAAVWKTANFVDGLVEQAAIAEPVRAQPPLVTELEQRQQRDGISSSDMFFDSASRDIGRSQQDEENLANAHALQTQVRLCNMINRMTGATAPGAGASIGAGAGGATHLTVGGRLLTLPERHRAVAGPMPQTRTDLEPLMRWSTEEMCVAMGVPASLVLEGRFASRTTAQYATPLIRIPRARTRTQHVPPLWLGLSGSLHGLVSLSPPGFRSLTPRLHASRATSTRPLRLPSETSMATKRPLMRPMRVKTAKARRAASPGWCSRAPKRQRPAAQPVDPRAGSN